MTLMFVIAMIIIFWLFHVFSRCTRGSIRSTVTREWEFRNLVRFCAFISSEKSLHQDHYHSHRHHNCFSHYSLKVHHHNQWTQHSRRVQFLHQLHEPTQEHYHGHQHQDQFHHYHNQWKAYSRRVQFLHQLHEPTKVPAGDVQGQYWVQILRSPHYFHHEKGDCFKTWFCWRSGLGRTWKWHLLLSQQPPHRSTCLGHAG